MTATNWKVLVVSGASGKAPKAELSVEANNWMDAVRAARKKLGESGSLPSGANCTVAEGEAVTVIDTAARRRFILEKVAPVAGAKKRESARPAAAKAAPAATEGQAAKARKLQTVAYQPKVHGPALKKELAVGKPAEPKKPAAVQPAWVLPAALKTAAKAPEAAKKIAPVKPVTVPGAVAAPAAEQPAVIPATVSGAVAAPAAEQPAVQARESKPSPRPPAEAAAEERDWLQQILARDEDPSGDNPLTYRERGFLVPKSLGLSEIEGAMRKRLAEIQQELANAPKGKFVNLAAFDHLWTERPDRPPLVVIQWKDWRGEPLVVFPASEKEPKTPSGRPVSYEEDKLAKAFEALHNLTFLTTPAEGVEFVMELLQDAIECEASNGCIYDINSNELRFVFASGPGAEERKGRGVTLERGILGQSATQDGSVKIIPEVEKNPGFDPEIDGKMGIAAKNMLLRPLVLENHLLGIIQLINRRQQPEFTAEDASLVSYVAEQLTEFIRKSRLRQEEKKE